MFAPSRSLCCSNRRRFDSSSQSTLWASNVFASAALNRTMRPFFLCTKRRASATCSSTRRRSSSKLFASGRTSPEHQYQHAGKSTTDQHQRRRAGGCNVDCGERQGGGRVFPLLDQVQLFDSASGKQTWPPPSTFASDYVSSMSFDRLPGSAWCDPDVLARRREELACERERDAEHHAAAAKAEGARINKEERKRFLAQQRH
jgi:hypothetical protein